MKQHAISLSEVTLTLGGSEIYRDVSFDVAEGEFVCLLGPSGCGKSTALRLIGDLLPVQGGRVKVEGLSPAEGWKRTAFVFQSPRLLPWKTTLENAAFGLEMRHPEIDRADRLERAQRELDHVGLGDDGHKMPVMLSGGERQRVSIARALALDPHIILMDEPFSALDHTTRTRLRQQIVDLWGQTGKTVLFVTHDIDEALFLADRIVVLSNKPTQVEDIVTVSAPRPRDPDASPELDGLRQRLIAIFETLEGRETPGALSG
ncbi:MAG: ABC transporter ATP-binding protein [Aestuariivita sp.]|uniref:ABC transporter ATP-binding protein n=1 Tax=Aestuariivita sp. TaxID=1872407 RepID=UPI003BB19F09